VTKRFWQCWESNAGCLSRRQSLAAWLFTPLSYCDPITIIIKYRNKITPTLVHKDLCYAVTVVCRSKRFNTRPLSGYPYYLGPCHHGMTRLRVSDREGLQIWKVAANILNKSRTTASLRDGERLGTRRHKKKLVTICHRGFGFWRIHWNDRGNWIHLAQYRDQWRTLVNTEINLMVP
jgi:hypothetical protein